MNSHDHNPASPPLWLLRGFLILMACGVGLGAFGAHALRDSRTPAQLEIWKTATLYVFVHALAGIFLCLQGQASTEQKFRLPHHALYFFFVGCLLFGGSLYALVLTNISILGAITPLGGVAFLIGWITLIVGVTNTRSIR